MSDGQSWRPCHQDQGRDCAVERRETASHPGQAYLCGEFYTGSLVHIRTRRIWRRLPLRPRWRNARIWTRSSQRSSRTTNFSNRRVEQCEHSYSSYLFTSFVSCDVEEIQQMVVLCPPRLVCTGILLRQNVALHVQIRVAIACRVWGVSTGRNHSRYCTGIHQRADVLALAITGARRLSS